MLPCASRPRSEIAISVPASGRPFGTTTSASMPLVVGQLARRRRQRHDFAKGARKTLGKIEAQHLVDALETDIDQRAVERERLGIEPAARGDRLAVGTEHRRGLDVVEPGHLAALVDDAAGEPAALVADRDEALALGIEPQARQSAEAAKPRGQDQPAAIFELAEPHTRPVAGVERGQRPGIDLDRDRRGDREFVGNGRLRRPLNGRLRQRRARARPPPKAPPLHISKGGGGLWAGACSHECRRRGRWWPVVGAAPWVSLNSSASFSVMAPPSSSASTMVTARR